MHYSSVCLCYTHTLSDFVLASAANVRGVLLCIKGGMPPAFIPTFYTFAFPRIPHPAFYWWPWLATRLHGLLYVNICTRGLQSVSSLRARRDRDPALARRAMSVEIWVMLQDANTALSSCC